MDTVGEFLVAMQMSREEWMSQVMASYDTCSRITLDEIQALLSEHGFGISRVELMTGQSTYRSICRAFR